MTGTILIVEDDSNDVFFMQQAFKKAGVFNPVQVVSDGQQAIDYFNGDGKYADRGVFPLPGLVLLDLKLPYVMGLDVLKWIRQETEAAAIVLIFSSSRDESDIAAAYRLGANGYLIKPLEVSKLLELVNSIKDYWLTHNSPPPHPTAQAKHGNLPAKQSREGATRHAGPPTPETLLNEVPSVPQKLPL